MRDNSGCYLFGFLVAMAIMLVCLASLSALEH